MKDIGIEFDGDLNPRFTAPCSQVQKNLQRYTMRLTEKELNRAIRSFVPLLSDLCVLEKWVSSENDLRPSLLRILLNCGSFQRPVIEQLGQFLEMTEFETDVGRLKRVTVQILRALTYLYHIQDYVSLTSVLLNAVEKCHESLKEVIIQNLFQIIPCDNDVLTRLTEMMSENVSLTSYVLMALDGVKGSDVDQNGIRRFVLDNILQAASTKDLPTVVKFLVSTTDDSNAASTIESLRTHLVIRDGRFRVDSLSVTDTYLFLITQFRHALQVNSSFLKCYVSTIEASKTDLQVLDIWIIFCMFSVTSLRSKAQQLIIRTACKTLTESGICESIHSHEQGMLELKGSLVDLMSWCLSSNDKNVVEIGMVLASSIFGEFNDVTSSSDIVSTLVTEIGLGSGQTPNKVAELLERLSYELPEKLKSECSLIEGILWSGGEISSTIFAKLAGVCARLTYNTAQSLSTEGSQLSIGFTKMIQSLKHSTKRNGVIGMATLINQYDDICGSAFQNVADLFNHAMYLIRDDLKCCLLFLNCIWHNRSRSNLFNDFLIDMLTTWLQDIINQKTGTELVDFEVSDGNDYLNILAFFNTSDRNTLRSRQYDERLRMNVVIFTSIGLSLLLDAHMSKGDNLRVVCDFIYRLGITTDFSELSPEDTVTALLFAHSYTMTLLNFFSDQVDDSIFVKYGQLLHIEDQIVSFLRQIDKYMHPLFGEVFPRHMNFLKRHKTREDSIAFIRKYRGSFVSASENQYNMLFKIPMPIEDDDLNTVLHLLIDYKHNLSLSSSLDEPFPTIPFVSLRVLGFLAKELLPYVIDDDRPTAIEITQTIFDVLKTQIALPLYKVKSNFNDLLTAIGRCDNRSACFVYYSKMMTGDLAQQVQLSLLLFLKELLHCGPSERIDIEGRECKLLCKLAKALLTCDSPVLDKNAVKVVLPIFFDHDSQVLDDVHLFITTVFPLEILEGNTCDNWPSLDSGTFSLYFNQCFLALNRKAHEIKRRISSNNFVITEEAIATIMNRLNKVTVIMKGLLLHTCTLSIPLDVLRVVLRQGVNWIECLVGLFPFLNDAKQCEDHAVQEFLELSRCIARQIQVIVDHVRRNEPTLQSLIPNISKSLASWTYTVKSAMGGRGNEGLKISTCRERTLLGELILTQAVTTGSYT